MSIIAVEDFYEAIGIINAGQASPYEFTAGPYV